MGTEDGTEKDRLATLAEDLSLPVTDETLNKIVERYQEDRKRVEQYVSDKDIEERSQRNSRGTMSDDKYNALLEVYHEPRIRDGTEGGLLDGLEVVVKDNIAVKELRMTCGLEDFSYVPSYDAVVVERLLDAGAKLIGKANMDGFAMGPGGQWSEFGPVVNPNHPSRVSGGSSSGSGAAVASGLADAALGTDTGGSIRSPASCCGIVGVRPTHRLVPRYGVSELAPTLDTVGPLARDVETAARVLEAISGYSLKDPTSSRVETESFVSSLDDPTDLEVGVIRSTLDMAEDDVATIIEETAIGLDNVVGVSTSKIDLEFHEFDFWFRQQFGTEIGWLLRQSFTTRGFGPQYEQEWHEALGQAQLNDHIAERVLPGAFMDEMTNGSAYIVARREGLKLKERIHELFDSVDILLTPAMRMVPPTPKEVLSADTRLKTNLTRPFSLAGLPAVSVPSGRVDGLPVNAQVVAPEFEDAKALKIANKIETLTETDQ